MSTVEVKLYPTERNPQFRPGPVPLAQFLAHLERVGKSAPDAEEASVMVLGHEAIEMRYSHTLTPLEQAQAKIAAAVQVLQGAGRQPLSPEAVAELLVSLQG